jgi:hypothetical protein
VARRYYANNAPTLQLASGITSLATTATMSTGFTGWPASVPYYAEFEAGTASAEIVLVTAVAGSVATITRGQDGTAGVSHSAGASFDAVLVAKDADEANAHVNASSGVHGISGSVVGTNDAQTLTNKTLTAPTISVPTVSGTLAGAAATFSGTLGVTGTSTLGATNTGALASSSTITAGTVFLPHTYATFAALPASPGAGAMAFISAVSGSIPGAGLCVYDGSAWQPVGVDTGWLDASALSLMAGSTGGSPTTTISSAKIRRVFNTVFVTFNWTVATGSITFGGTGNSANTEIAVVTNSWFLPGASAPTAQNGLTSANSGGDASYYIAPQSGGQSSIVLGNVDGGTASPLTGTLGCGGSYLVG